MSQRRAVQAARELDTNCQRKATYLLVEGVDQFYQEVSARGVEVISRPTTEPWGLREFSIRTPDGHRIRLGELIPVAD